MSRAGPRPIRDELEDERRERGVERRGRGTGSLSANAVTRSNRARVAGRQLAFRLGPGDLEHARRWVDADDRRGRQARQQPPSRAGPSRCRRPGPAPPRATCGAGDPTSGDGRREHRRPVTRVASRHPVVPVGLVHHSAIVPDGSAGCRTAPTGDDANRSRNGMVSHVDLDLPFEPPVEPMLAKAVDELPGGRRLAVRAQVGWLPGDRVPLRRRDPTPSRGTSNRSTDTFPSSPIRFEHPCRSAACSTARSSSPRTGRSISRPCCYGSIRPSRG